MTPEQVQAVKRDLEQESIMVVSGHGDTTMFVLHMTPEAVKLGETNGGYTAYDGIMEIIPTSAENEQLILQKANESNILIETKKVDVDFI